MANYQSTKKLETEIEGLRNTRGSGLLQAMRNLKQRKLEKQLGTVAESNDNLRTQELAMLLKGDQTGRVGDSYVARRADQFVPRHPELVDALRTEGVNARARDRTASIVEFEASQKNPAFAEFLRSSRSAADPSDMEMYMNMSPEDRAAALEFRRNPYLDQGNQYTNVTRPDDVVPINVSPDNLPSTRGAQAAAVQGAEIAAIPQRVAAQTAAERQAQIPQAQARLASEQRQATLVDSFIDQAAQLAGGWTTGIMGSTLSGVPGTPAHDLAAVIDTIEANVGFDKLNQMRQQSPTGGALGSVTERELSLLSATLGSLKQSQSPEQFRQNLETLRQQVQQIVHGSEQQFQQTYGGSVIQGADEILRQAGIIQ
jgi:hypothetical protein